jgi:hypothetical protein
VTLLLAVSSPVNAKTKVFLVLANGFTFNDFESGDDLALVREIAARGSIGLIQPMSDGEPSEPAVYLSIGAGLPMAAPREQGPRFLEAGVERTVADLAIDTFPAVGREGDIVCRAYRRRFGEYCPLEAEIVHVSLPALLRAQSAQGAKALGGFAETFKRAGKQMSAHGDWRSSLIAMDSRGAVMEGSLFQLSNEQVKRLLNSVDLMIVSPDTPNALRRYTRIGMELAESGTANVLIANPFSGIKAGNWSEPGFIIAFGPNFKPNTLLTSERTRRNGLISAVDIAPGILRIVGVPPPYPGVGKPFYAVSGGSKPMEALKRLREGLMEVTVVRSPVLTVHLWLAILAPLVTLIGLGTERSGILVVGLFLLRAMAVSVVAFLLTALNPPTTLWGSIAVSLGWSFMLGGVVGLLRRFHPLLPLGVAVLITVLVVGSDVLTGSALVGISVLGDYNRSTALWFLMGWAFFAFVEWQVAQSKPLPVSQEPKPLRQGLR